MFGITSIHHFLMLPIRNWVYTGNSPPGEWSGIFVGNTNNHPPGRDITVTDISEGGIYVTVLGNN